MKLLNKLAYLRSKKIISNAITDALEVDIYENVVDKDSQKTKLVSFKAFNSNYPEFDAQFMSDLILMIYKELCELGDVKQISANFLKTLDIMGAIRIDMSDHDLENTTLSNDFSELKNDHAEYVQRRLKEIQTEIHKVNNLIKMAAQDGLKNEVAEARKNCLIDEYNSVQNAPIGNAVSTPNFHILVPSLSEDLHSFGDVVDSILKFIHEFIHMLTNTDKNIGLWFANNGNWERGIWDDINEGLTEYIAEKICKKIVKSKAIKPFLLNGKSEVPRHYVLRVDVVKDLIKLFPEGKIEELYLSGKSEEIINMLKTTKNENNETLYDLLNSYPKGKNIINSGEDKDSENAKNNLSEKLKHFVYLESEKSQNL